VHDAGEQCDMDERRERCRTMWTSGLVRTDRRTPGLIITVVALSCVDFNIALKVIFFESVTVPQYLI
jgi:hypothetical protein